MVADTNYVVRINGSDYLDGSTAYICDPDTSAQVEILYNGTFLPVNAIEWDWSDCECTAHPMDDHRASYDIGNFGTDDKLAIKLSFKDQALTSTGDSTKLKVVVQKDVELKVDHRATVAAATYAYDDNKIPEYPFYTRTERPYKLLVAGTADDVIVANDQHLAGLPVASDPSGMLVTNTMGKTLTITDASAGHGDSCIMSTCVHDTLLHVDVVPQKTMEVHLYTLCESNDDIENYCIDKNGINGPYEPGDIDGSLMPDCFTPISSLPISLLRDYQCLQHGQDGTVDHIGSYWNPSSLVYKDQDNDLMKPVDRYFSPDMTNVNATMYASISVTAGNVQAFCNSRAVTPRTMWNADHNGDGILDCYVDAGTCPTALSPLEIQNIEANLNTIYNKVGLQVVVIDHGKDTVNYDFYDGNEMTDKKDVDTDLKYLLASQTGGDYPKKMIAKKDITIYIVDRPLSGYVGWGANQVTTIPPVLGRAAIVRRRGLPDDTIAHEIGHAVFGLFHPNDAYHVYNGIKNPVVNDTTNLMNSFPLCPSCPISQFEFRKYQWTLIVE